MAKLRIKKIDTSTGAEVDTEVEVDDETGAEVETPNTEDTTKEDKEGKGDDPNVSETTEGKQEDKSDPTLDETIDDITDKVSEDLKQGEEELIELYHEVANGTLIVANRAYNIVDHTVKVLAEDFQACIHHGLQQPKE